MIFFVGPKRVLIWLGLFLSCGAAPAYADENLPEKKIFYVVESKVQGELVETIPAWLMPTLIFGIAFACVAGLLIHNNVLKRRLNQQTIKLREQEQQVILLASNMSDWVWTLDANQHFAYVSPSVKKLLGYRADELLHQDLSSVLHSSEIEHAYALLSHMLAAAKRDDAEKYRDATIDLAHRHKNGQIIWAETAIRIFFDGKGNFTGAQGSSRNISERKRAEETLRQLAFNDPLTQIPNRRLLTDRIHHAQAGCVRHKQYCALFFIDLDNFKYVNDNYGHDSGDLLLQQVAQRLFANARESDTVARFGGDEFVVVSEFLNPDYEEARTQASLIGAKLMELFERNFLLRDVNCRLSASIGVHLFNNDHKTLDYMIKQADTAMYQAKAKGKNQLMISGENLLIECAV